MIVITGATGGLGSQTVEKLLERVPAGDVGVSVRDPDAATGLAERGVRVRRGDFTEPGTLADAFEGATQVLIVSGNTLGDDGVALHAGAIDAAVAAGAQRVLYTAHQNVTPDSAFAPARDHAATEQHLARCGVAFTTLRNGFYARTVPMLIADAATSGEIVAPADGPVSWTDRDDLAEAAAIVLADGGLDGLAAPLTAAEAHDLADVAQILGELTGRTIRRVVVEDEEWIERLVGRGVPREQAGFMLGLFVLGLFEAAHRGEFDETDPALGEILGREPRSLRDVLRSELS